MAAKPVPQFSFLFDGAIWQVFADAGRNRLAVEVRSSTSQRVTFAAIDASTGWMLWQDRAVDETWWVNAIQFHHRTLLLQTYPDRQLPQPRGLIALDDSTGNVRWQHPGYGYVKTVPDGWVVYELRMQQPAYFLLDPESGAVRQSLSAEQVHARPAANDAGIIHPVHYTPENPHFHSMVEFLAKNYQIRTQSVMDYAEYAHGIVISYYIYENNQYTQFLLAADENASVVWHEPIASGLAGPGFHPFLIVNQQLIFVKNRNELVSYAL